MNKTQKRLVKRLLKARWGGGPVCVDPAPMSPFLWWALEAAARAARKAVNRR